MCVQFAVDQSTLTKITSSTTSNHGAWEAEGDRMTEATCNSHTHYAIRPKGAVEVNPYTKRKLAEWSPEQEIA